MVYVGTCGYVDMVLLQNTKEMKDIHTVELG